MEGEKGCGCEEGKWKWKGETQPDATDRILHSHCGLCTHPNRALFANQLINNFFVFIFPFPRTSLHMMTVTHERTQGRVYLNFIPLVLITDNSKIDNTWK